MKEIIEELRNGMYAKDRAGNEILLIYPSNPLTLKAADEIEALEAELKEIRMNYAILSDRYLALRDRLRDKDWNDCWD